MANISQSDINKAKNLVSMHADESPGQKSKLSHWLTEVTDSILGTNLSGEFVHMMRGWNGANDPVTLFRTLQSFARGQVPIDLPSHLSGEQLSNLKNLAQEWFSTEGPSVNNPNMYSGDAKINLHESDQLSYSSKLIKLNETKESNFNVAKSHKGKIVSGEKRDSKYGILGLDNVPKSILDRYGWVFQDPTSGGELSIKSTSPTDLVKQLNERTDFKFGIGYKYTSGLEIGNTALWNLQIYPYKPNSGIAMGHPGGNRYSVVPDLPSYRLPDLSRNSTGITFSYSTYCPVLTWQLSWGNLDTMDIPLFNGSGMQIPVGFKYNMVLSLRILDDVYLSMDKYMRHYINSIYNVDNNCVAPYWATAFWIPITIFRRGYEINYRFNLICVPTNWSPTMENGDFGTEQSVTIEFSVIGIQTYSNESAKVYPSGIDANGSLKNLNWKNITLRAN